MATPVIRHATLTGAPADPRALVDGPAWDEAHTVTGLENVPNVDTSTSANVSFLQSGTDAITRTMQNKAREVLSVTDFGATGDGTTNDYAAIVKADTAAAASGKALFFPAGYYNIGGNTYTPSAGMRVMGEHKASTVIRSTSATANIMNLSNGSEAVENLQFQSTVPRTGGYFINITSTGSMLRDLFLSSPFNGINIGAGASSILLDNVSIIAEEDGTGIEMSGGLLIQMRNVSVVGDGHAIGLAVHAVGDITLVDCNFIGATLNLWINPTTGQGVASLLSIACWYDQATSHNILIAPSGTGVVHRCAFEGGWACGGDIVSTTGFSLAASGSASINGITITGMDLFGAEYGVAADGAGISNLIISNNKIAGNSVHGVSLNDVDGAIINGNKIGSTGSFGVNGTGLSITGASDNIAIGSNDLNGNTAPLALTTSGTKISFANNLGISGWRSFTPTIVSSAGTITTVGTVSGSYLLTGSMVHWNVRIDITDNGTGAGDLRVTNMPFTAAARSAFSTGRDVSFGTAIQAFLVASTTLLLMAKITDNSYPAATGSSIFANGSYEIAP